MTRLASLFGAIFLAGAFPLEATEKASPALQRERQTSTAREISVKPLFVYSARGRRDPFSFVISLGVGGGNDTSDFNIAELKLVGFVGDSETRTALFRNLFRGTTYRFRHGQLFSPGGTPVPNIKGSVLQGRQVTLTQGETNIMYRMSSGPKLQSLDATIAQERKELQR